MEYDIVGRDEPYPGLPAVALRVRDDPAFVGTHHSGREPSWDVDALPHAVVATGVPLGALRFVLAAEVEEIDGVVREDPDGGGDPRDKELAELDVVLQPDEGLAAHLPQEPDIGFHVVAVAVDVGHGVLGGELPLELSEEILSRRHGLDSELHTHAGIVSRRAVK